MSTKFQLHWYPYFRIIEQSFPVNFKIRHQLTGKTKLVHSENLQPAHPDDDWDSERPVSKKIVNHEKVSRTQPLRQKKKLASSSNTRELGEDFEMDISNSISNLLDPGNTILEAPTNASNVDMEFDETPRNIIESNSDIPVGIDVDQPSGDINDSDSEFYLGLRG
ncbi:hypothetical protein SNE40_010845 [Patella caerulea]|uniref:Uncharacterized protein n=1 Tax=Patella caerulea TaxID=87958 RepID=A0AAN8Q5J9_PATCE